MYPVDGPGPPSSGSKPKHATESPKTSVSKSKELTGNPVRIYTIPTPESMNTLQMESELSSVTDEPPKKRQKKQEKVCIVFSVLYTDVNHKRSPRNLQKTRRQNGERRRHCLKMRKP